MPLYRLILNLLRVKTAKAANFTESSKRIKVKYTDLGQSFSNIVLIKPIFIIFAVLQVAACNTTPDITPSEELTHIRQIQTFEVKGKIAILTPRNKDSINYYWKQDNDKYDIRFNTFLGVEVARIQGDYQNITIEADGKTYQSTEPEVLLEEVTGWKIPLRRLSQWLTGNVKGVVMAKHADSELPKKVLVRVSSEEEWMIEYNNYKAVHQLQLPYRLALKQYKLKINLAISEWKIN